MDLLTRWRHEKERADASQQRLTEWRVKLEKEKRDELSKKLSVKITEKVDSRSKSRLAVPKAAKKGKQSFMTALAEGKTKPLHSLFHMDEPRSSTITGVEKSSSSSSKQNVEGSAEKSCVKSAPPSWFFCEF